MTRLIIISRVTEPQTCKFLSIGGQEIAQPLRDGALKKMLRGKFVKVSGT